MNEATTAFLEPPKQYITLQRASEISGISQTTLGNQARARGSTPPRLRTVKLGHTLVTTRVWLHEYLIARQERRGGRKPLPEDYVAPESPAPVEDSVGGD